MKAKKYIYSGLLLVGCMLFPSCESKLDIPQHGVSNIESYYQTDDEAEEAIVTCYSKWKDVYQPAFWIKNLLSDDCYSAGESWTAASAQFLSTYTFDADFGQIKTLYTNLYNTIYAANIVLQNVGEDSQVKLRARAEAKVFRDGAVKHVPSREVTPRREENHSSSSAFSIDNMAPSAMTNLTSANFARRTHLAAFIWASIGTEIQSASGIAKYERAQSGLLRPIRSTLSPFFRPQSLKYAASCLTISKTSPNVRECLLPAENTEKATLFLNFNAERRRSSGSVGQKNLL